MDDEPLAGSRPADHTTEQGDKPVLVAYLHLRLGTLPATRGLLTDFVAEYSAKHGYSLGRLFVTREGRDEVLALRDLVSEIGRSDAKVVVVAGDSVRAYRVLSQMSGIRVVALADIARGLVRERSGRAKP